MTHFSNCHQLGGNLKRLTLIPSRSSSAQVGSVSPKRSSAPSQHRLVAGSVIWLTPIATQRANNIPVIALMFTYKPMTPTINALGP